MPLTVTHHPWKYATHATHASIETHVIHTNTNSTPFLKLVKKFTPLKNCHFWDFHLYFDQKIIIIKRQLQVYATCSKFGTWMPSWTLLYITSRDIWALLSYVCKTGWTRKNLIQTYIRNVHAKFDSFWELMVVFRQHLLKKVWILRM